MREKSYTEGLRRFLKRSMGVDFTPPALKEYGRRWAEKMRYYYAYEPEMIRENIKRREKLIGEYERRIEKHRKAISRLKKRLRKLEGR